MVDIYLPCLFVAQLISTNIHQHFGEKLVWYIPYRNQKKWFISVNTTKKLLEIDFVSLPAWQWIVLADHFWTSESAYMKCTLHLCGIFWQVIFVNIRFFVNCCAQKIKKAKSNLLVLLFHVIALLFIRETAFNISCQFSETYQIFFVFKIVLVFLFLIFSCFSLLHVTGSVLNSFLWCTPTEKEQHPHLYPHPILMTPSKDCTQRVCSQCKSGQAVNSSNRKF